MLAGSGSVYTSSSSTEGGPAVAKASSLSGGAGRNGCSVDSQTSSSSCAGKKCCAVSQKVQKCGNYTLASATVNDESSHCCIILLEGAKKVPTLFCATDAKDASYGYVRMPSSWMVTLHPTCDNDKGGKYGSVSCIAKIPALPNGYSYPTGFTPSNPLKITAGSKSEFGSSWRPGGSSKYTRMLQVVSTTKPLKLTSKYE